MMMIHTLAPRLRRYAGSTICTLYIQLWMWTITFLTNLEPRQGLCGPVPGVVFCRPRGARLRNLCDASAKSRTATRTLLSGGTSCSLPSLPWPSPPSISDMLFKAPSIFYRSVWRIALSRGQSISTCTTVSVAPHSHCSSSRKPRCLPYVASHEWPVRSCVSRYARFRRSEPYRRRDLLDGRPRSMRRRCPPFSEVLHSCSHSCRCYSASQNWCHRFTQTVVVWFFFLDPV